MGQSISGKEDAPAEGGKACVRSIQHGGGPPHPNTRRSSAVGKLPARAAITARGGSLAGVCAHLEFRRTPVFHDKHHRWWRCSPLRSLSRLQPFDGMSSAVARYLVPSFPRVIRNVGKAREGNFSMQLVSRVQCRADWVTDVFRDSGARESRLGNRIVPRPFAFEIGVEKYGVFPRVPSCFLL